MVETFKKRMVIFEETLHQKIFGHAMGEVMRSFVRSLGWSFFGGIISSVILFAVNILAGRWLGPNEYGKYGLIVAISSIFIIPMTLGIDTAATYYISKSSSERDKRIFLASSASFTGIIILVLTAIGFIVSAKFADLFFTHDEIIKYVLFFSFFLAAKNILSSFLRGFHLFKLQSLIKIGEGVLVVVVFLVLIKILKLYNFNSYIFAVVSGFFFTNLLILYKLRRLLHISFKYTKKVISYGIFGIMGSTFGIMINSFDKIMINKFIGEEQLGIYIAYSTISIVLMSQIMALFINVFFPFLSAMGSGISVLKKINKLAMIFFIPCFFILYMTTAVVIMLFGKNYPFDWMLAGGFSFLGTLFVYFTALWWLIASKDESGIKFTSYNGLISGSFFIFLLLFFRETLSLYHVVMFLIGVTLYNVIIGNFYYAKIK